MTRLLLTLLFFLVACLVLAPVVHLYGWGYTIKLTGCYGGAGLMFVGGLKVLNFKR